jgi:hypothetical protein
MSNTTTDTLTNKSNTLTASIAQEYSLLPIFIFCLFKEGEQNLLITSHAERHSIDFSLIKQEIDIEIISPDLSTKQKSLAVEQIADQKQNAKRSYRNIVFDIVDWFDETAISRYSELLTAGGNIVVLDWRKTLKQSIKQLFGFLLSNHQALYLPKKLQRKKFLLKHHLIVEPNLEKPLELLPFSAKTSANPSTESAIRTRILKTDVGYYLLPHHQVCIYQNTNTGDGSVTTSVLERLISQLSDSPDRKYKTVEIKKIIISTTNTLLLKIGIDQKEYFVRFPLTRDSLQRQLLQQFTLSRLNDANIAIVPQQIPLNGEFISVFAETAIPGKVYEDDFAKKDAAFARKLFLNAQTGIAHIHQQIGKPLNYDRKYHRLLFEKRFTFLQSQFPHTTDKLKEIETMIFNELNGKKVLVGICHGDFKVGNCLFDNQLNLQGIIDWDMSEYPGLSVLDLSSLLGRGLRHRNLSNIAKLVMQYDQLNNEFSDIIPQYFEVTETDPIDTHILLWLYWVDRMYKQIKFGTVLHKYWVDRNIVPVLGNVE